MTENGMTLRYRWKASFTLHNVLVEKPFTFDGFRIAMHAKSTKENPVVLVTFHFTTESYDQNIFRTTKEKIERLLDVTAVNSVLTGVDLREIMTDFDLTLENWTDIHLAGMEAPSKSSFTFRNTGGWTEAFVLHCLGHAEELAKVPDSPVLFRILRLLRLSVWDSDEYERFSKAWRSFNALYNHIRRSRKGSEISRIEFFADKLLATDSKWLKGIIESYCSSPPGRPIQDYLTFILATRNSENLLQDLAKQNFVDENGVDHSARLSKWIGARDIGKALKSALSCTYVERNRVLHGEVYSDEERDLLYICSAFLQRIISVALNEFFFIPIAEQT